MTFDAFILKKIVSLFVHLVPGVPLLMILALLLMNWVPRLSRRCLWSCALVLLLFSSPFSSNVLVNGLETRYQTLQNAPDDTRIILVLASGHFYRPDRPDNSVLSAVALSRVMEGIRLWKTNRDAILVTSGGQSTNQNSGAEFAKSLAIEYGVPSNQIRKLEQVRDTDDEILLAVNFLKTKDTDPNPRLIIVSSAIHLARAERIVMPYNVAYTMAPTDYLGSEEAWYRFNAGYLNNVDRVIHEYVGMLWQWIRS